MERERVKAQRCAIANSRMERKGGGGEEGSARSLRQALVSILLPTRPPPTGVSEGGYPFLSPYLRREGGQNFISAYWAAGDICYCNETKVEGEKSGGITKIDINSAVFLFRRSSKCDFFSWARKDLFSNICFAHGLSILPLRPSLFHVSHFPPPSPNLPPPFFPQPQRGGKEGVGKEGKIAARNWLWRLRRRCRKRKGGEARSFSSPGGFLHFPFTTSQLGGAPPLISPLLFPFPHLCVE